MDNTVSSSAAKNNNHNNNKNDNERSDVLYGTAAIVTHYKMIIKIIIKASWP
ncbi:MAG TPA: hypothetical protein VE076_10480 [Nitrososphaeraceae archaeon]|nr:hypothetical protein [Nitrososphaeraceae archaeon]